MALASESVQLSSTTLFEHYCWQKHDFRRKSRSNTSVGIDNRLLGKLSYPAASSVPRCNSGNRKIIFSEACDEPNVVSSTDGTFIVERVAGIGLPEHTDAPNVDDSEASVLSNPSGSTLGPSTYVGHIEQPERSTSGATDDVLSLASPSDRLNLPPARLCDDSDACDAGAKDIVSTSTTPAGPDAPEEMGKIRRFSLTEPGLLKTLQEGKPLTAFEKSKFDLIMKFKLTNDNLKGQLVTRAVRTEQLKDLEDLLTDSYTELMWGPLTYRPALAWILRTYLRERQSCLPHAATLVALYKPSEETNIDQGSSPKWWLAGAVEVSFNASGKPKDIQTPLPPDNAPFLSNMAVLKKFRRRGIGRELLRAAEELTMQMGGNEMYLHCRMVDEAPLNLYKSSGYSVAETDSLLSLVLFQRRRHLMYKRLGVPVGEE